MEQPWLESDGDDKVDSFMALQAHISSTERKNKSEEMVSIQMIS